MTTIKEEAEEVIFDEEFLSSKDVKTKYVVDQKFEVQLVIKDLKDDEDPKTIEKVASNLSDEKSTKENESSSEDEKPNVIALEPKLTPEISTSNSNEKSKEVKFECPECHKVYKSADFLAVHKCVKPSTKTGKFDCSFCNTSYYCDTYRKYHEIEKHSDAPKILQCDECPRAFATKNYLLTHIKEHRKAIIKCEFCKKDIRSAGYRKHVQRVHRLMEKILVVEAEKEFKCSKCVKSFSNKRHLKSHEATHDQRFTCHLCPKKFSEKSSLDDHLLVHENLRTFKCLKCNKAFNTRKSLYHHQNVHKELGSYSCEACGKAFKNRPNLLQHVKFACKVLKG